MFISKVKHFIYLIFANYRRGRGATRARGRGIARTESPQPNVPRLVPISWAADSPQQVALAPSPARGLRSAQLPVRPTTHGTPGVPSPRGTRGRGRPRGPRSH